MSNIETRNASLADLAMMLKAQHEQKLDAVVPATAIRSMNGNLIIDGMSYEAAAGLPSGGAGIYRPTGIMDAHLAEKLNVPLAFLRRMRETRIDVYDGLINSFLHGTAGSVGLGSEWRGLASPGVAGDAGPAGPVYPDYQPDQRKFLVRTFMDLAGGEGIGRALLSNGFKVIDNLDALTAALQGVREAGRAVEVVSADLTETRMVVKVACPDFAVMAPSLLEAYRPQAGGWTLERAREAARREAKGFEPGKEPVVFAGFEISNSETGGGAFQIVPRAVVMVCRNGLKFDAASQFRMVHLGAKLDEGAIRWSDATYQRNLEMVSSMAADAVRTYLDRDWLAEQIAGVERKAGRELAEPQKAVELVAKTLKFSEETTNGILDHFIKGGQPTAGGLLNAITSYSQSEAVSAEQSYELENVALRAMEIAANA